MVVKFKKEMIRMVAITIGGYVFKELREGNQKDIEWLNDFCKLRREMEEREETSDETISIDVGENICRSLPLMIKKNIFDDIKELMDDDMPWVCEMMNIYDQVKSMAGEEAKPAPVPAPEKAKKDETDDSTAQDIGYEKVNLNKPAEVAEVRSEELAAMEVKEPDEESEEFDMNEYEFEDDIII